MKNSSQRHAVCKACKGKGQTVQVAGTSKSMGAHLRRCLFLSAADKAAATGLMPASGKRKALSITPAMTSVPESVGSPLSVSSAASGSSSAPSAKRSLSSQATFSVVAFENSELPADDQRDFERLLLRATISANLPFTWIENPHVISALQKLRPRVKLPSRRRLAGKVGGTSCCITG